jgi:hypothetical protein
LHLIADEYGFAEALLKTISHNGIELTVSKGTWKPRVSETESLPEDVISRLAIPND